MEISSDKQYQWNQNWVNKIAHTDINLVIAELNEIIEVHGDITPTLVVESSRNKRSILHSYFEWDDNVAATKWRLRQASKLLGCIEVKIITDNEPRVFRVYQTTTKRIGEGDTGYVKFDIENPNIDYIKMLCINHLSSVQKRLQATGLWATALSYVNKAINEFSKESTETKEEIKPVLSAVS